MKFTIRIETGDEHALTSSNEIEWALSRLAVEPGSFLCIEPEAPIHGFTFIQASYIRKTKGFFRKEILAEYYSVELQEELENGDLYLYTLETEDWSCVLESALAFYESCKLPDLSLWEKELFYKNTH